MAQDSAAGFEAGESVTSPSARPGVRFDPDEQVLHDSDLPGRYVLTPYVRDQTTSFTLYTSDNEAVTGIFANYDWTASGGHRVRVYAVCDFADLSPAARAVRERLDFKAFASAVAATQSWRRAKGPCTIYYQPLATGEILGN